MAQDHVKETNQTSDRSATVGRLTLNRRLVTAATESLLQENNWRKLVMRFVGVDLHSNSLTACYLSENGNEEMRTFDFEELRKFQETLQVSDQVAVEATGNTRLFREAIKNLVSKVVVVNPNQFEVIRKSVKKIDRHDARTLALFLSKEMLAESRLKEPANAPLNSVAHTRDKLVKLRTTLINKLHALQTSQTLSLPRTENLKPRSRQFIIGK